MVEYATKQDIRAIVKEELTPVLGSLTRLDSRMAKMEARQERVEKRQDRVENRQDRAEERQDRTELNLKSINENYRAILIQNEHMNSKLDAVLEYVRDVPDIKTRVTRLEETVEQEKSKTELNRYHLDLLRQDADAHRRQPHPGK